MRQPEHVYRLEFSVDDTYPRLLTSHPRNRGVDWRRYWQYVADGVHPEQADVNLFHL